MPRTILLASSLVAVLACRESRTPVEPEINTISAEIADGAHGDGNPGFFFLPPLVPKPPSTGAMDLGLATHVSVEICAWNRTARACAADPVQTFSGSEIRVRGRADREDRDEQDDDGDDDDKDKDDRRMGDGEKNKDKKDKQDGKTRDDEGDPDGDDDDEDGDDSDGGEDEAYHVNWKISRTRGLQTGTIYAIRILVAGTELGFTEVVVGRNGREARELGRRYGVVGLRLKQTLPIRFRIEKGAVFVVDGAGGTISAMTGRVELTIAPGTLDRPVGIVVRPGDGFPADATLVEESVVDLRPHTLALASPAVLTITYDPAVLPAAVPEDDLRLHHVVEATWAEIFDSRVDPGSDRVEGSIHQLGTFGVLRMRAVATVRVQPRSAQVVVGQTIRLGATALDANQRPLARAITWASSAPSSAHVDDTGLVTGRASGRAEITASHGGHAGVARIIVTNPAYPHEPPGFMRLTERPFSAREEDGWRTTPSTAFQIVEDATAPQSGSFVAQAEYPAGFLGGDAPVWSEFGDFSRLSYRKLYVSFWIKVSEDWQGHDSFFNKIGFLWMHGAAVVFPTIKGKDSGSLVSRIGLQAIPVVVARNLDPNVDSVEIIRGRWHRWEIVVVANTDDNADGEVRWWIDGRKVGEYTDVMLRHALQSDIFQYVTWYPVWGGAGDVVEDTMYMWIDHYYASGSP